MEHYKSTYEGAEVDAAIAAALAIDQTLESALAPLNQQLAQIGSKLGDLTQLETEEKTNLVGAVNEVNGEFSEMMPTDNNHHFTISDKNRYKILALDSYIIVDENGNIKTKKFNSQDTEDAPNTIEDEVREFSVADVNKNKILGMKGYMIVDEEGTIHTKNFDSSELQSDVERIEQRMDSFSEVNPLASATLNISATSSSKYPNTFIDYDFVNGHSYLIYVKSISSGSVIGDITLNTSRDLSSASRVQRLRSIDGRCYKFTCEYDGIVCALALATFNPDGSPTSGTTILYLYDYDDIERQFSASLAAENRKFLVNNNDALPSYYDDYLALKADEINEVIRKSGRYSDSFFFITDVHTSANTQHSAAMLKYLMQRTWCGKTIFGGDAVAALTGKDEAFLMGEVGYINRLAKAVLPFGDFYYCRGNHDVWVYQGENTAWSNTGVKNVMLYSNPKLGSIVIDDDTENDGVYYYFDNKAGKVRYIFLDTQDYTNAYEAVYGVSKDQMDFVYQAIATAESCPNIVIVQHVPSLDTTNVPSVAAFEDAFARRSSVRFSVNSGNSHLEVDNEGSIVYDFSSISADIQIKAVICGHHHRDMEAYKNGLLEIESCCDAQYGYAINAFGDVKYRNTGSTNEQCIDFVNMDFSNDIITIVRVGVGYNRKFHTIPTSLAIGATTQVTPTIAATSYTSFNSYGSTYSGGSWTIPNNVVSVGSDGVVTAIAAGSAFVLATDADGNMEFFIFNVE